MLLANITSDTGWEFQCGESSKEENVKKTTIWNIVKKETRTPEGTVLIPKQDTQSMNVAVSLFVQTFYQWRAPLLMGAYHPLCDSSNCRLKWFYSSHYAR